MVIKKTVSVNLENIDDEYKPLCKPEMSYHDVGVLGVVLLKHKLHKFVMRFKRK